MYSFCIMVCIEGSWHVNWRFIMWTANMQAQVACFYYCWPYTVDDLTPTHRVNKCVREAHLHEWQLCGLEWIQCSKSSCVGCNVQCVETYANCIYSSWDLTRRGTFVCKFHALWTAGWSVASRTISQVNAEAQVVCIKQQIMSFRTFYIICRTHKNW